MKTLKPGMQNSTVTMRDLAQVANTKRLREALQYYYGRKWSQLLPVLKRLREAPKRKVDGTETIHIEVGGFPDERFTKPLKDRWESYHIDTRKTGSDERWSLSFRAWNTLSNLPISQETLDHYTLEEMLAHFIYEITWYGTEADMQKARKELFGRAKEITRGLDSGNTENLMTTPELRKSLGIIRKKKAQKKK